MLIPPDSPLRNPPAAMAAEQRVSIDGLRYAVDMIELSSGRLLESLLSISENQPAQPHQHGIFTRCFADAWSVVDSLWRQNLIIRRVPGLKRTPEIELHLRSLGALKKLRGGHQHIDERINQCVRDQLPLWGTLGWVFFPDGATRPGRIFVMIPGSLRSGETPWVIPRGQPTGVDIVTLTAFGLEIVLSDMVRRVSQLIVGLDQGLRVATSGQPGAGADAIITADFEPSR